jgi:hypothetical protein
MQFQGHGVGQVPEAGFEAVVFNAMRKAFLSMGVNNPGDAHLALLAAEASDAGGMPAAVATSGALPAAGMQKSHEALWKLAGSEAALVELDLPPAVEEAPPRSISGCPARATQGVVPPIFPFFTSPTSPPLPHLFTSPSPPLLLLISTLRNLRFRRVGVGAKHHTVASSWTNPSTHPRARAVLSDHR